MLPYKYVITGEPYVALHISTAAVVVMSLMQYVHKIQVGGGRGGTLIFVPFSSLFDRAVPCCPVNPSTAVTHKRFHVHYC